MIEDIENIDKEIIVEDADINQEVNTQNIEVIEANEQNEMSTEQEANIEIEDIEIESIDAASENVIQKEIPIIGNIANALKSDLRAQVETVLFVTDKPLKTGALATTLNASYDDVQAAVLQLIQEYEDRNGGLEVGTDDGYIIQVRTQYLSIVTEMMPLEINPGPLRTLSAIALKEPCLQSEVVDMRGSSAYEQISELVEMDLVSKKSQGMSYILKTTQKFKMYFRLSPEANKIKEKLQEKAKKLAKEREEKKLQEEEDRMTEAKEILEGTNQSIDNKPKIIGVESKDQKNNESKTPQEEQVAS